MPPADLLHHLSTEARERKPNLIRDVWKSVKRGSDIVSLANGDPHYTLYPLRRLQYEVPSLCPEDPVSAWRAAHGTATSQTFTSHIDEHCALSIRTALQYSTGAGSTEARESIMEINKYYHNPPNHVVTLALGNADALSKCFRLFGEPGDNFIADEYAFTALTSVAESQGIGWVPVRLDAGGMVPEELHRILLNWDDACGRRPHVIYLVPCGQNPTGSTLSIERRKRIYEIAQEFDLLIIEDDPYYFLQFGSCSPEVTDSSHNLLPSFLSMDEDGRIIRVDSFSKIIAPGMRLGWITSNPAFQPYIIAITDASSQHPHGFGQMFITELLAPTGWQLRGFDKWVHSLRAEYQRQRDFFVKVFHEEVEPSGLAEMQVPQAGMFVWVRVNMEKHSRYRDDLRISARSMEPRTNAKDLMAQLFDYCLDNGVAFMPGSVFALSSHPALLNMDSPVEDRVNYCRMTFSGTQETIQKGLSRFGGALRNFFNLDSLSADAETRE
ncbi:L-tyrosine:2-oxoglutarate aminotransferase [Wolfiporia cocos MD-104 SS10]|uniref:L-tyrosine:2-oxoglutarate aminotransferase n=1 Tax=Wolfiporia cocos (strain MD-104) TaxID=742152 RepID=A0A2H3JGS9_WOLCO|nr:L-tyrosine:2-oxoglutarate aminotransferase [Wolfiporia cocos MD-104 SS10]